MSGFKRIVQNVQRRENAIKVNEKVNLSNDNSNKKNFFKFHLNKDATDETQVSDFIRGSVKFKFTRYLHKKLKNLTQARKISLVFIFTPFYGISKCRQ